MLKRINFDAPEDFHRAVKQAGVTMDMSMREVTLAALEEYLQRRGLPTSVDQSGAREERRGEDANVMVGA